MQALPKAHLHLHLSCCMRRETLAELAERYGLRRVEAAERWASFAAFSATYQAARAVLRTPQDLRRLVDEAVADAAADGAVWIEPSTSVVGYAGIVGGTQPALELLLDAADAAAARHGVGVGLIITANREKGVALAEELARLAVRYADDGVVGFGLAGDERYPPEPFASAFAIAGEAGLLRVPHAGEQAGPPSVWGALDALGPDRIEHGVRAVEDPRLVARLAEAGICLDVCLASNVALGVVPTIAKHPLPALLDAGVPCSLNADAPLLFSTGLLGEYAAAREQLLLSDEHLAGVARASLRASRASETLRTDALTAIGAWLDGVTA